MTEHPIIFTGDSVRGILSGVKTMTRRVVKFRKPYQDHYSWTVCYKTDDGGWLWSNCDLTKSNEEDSAKVPGKKCPYGKPGDRLWMKETWTSIGGETSSILVIYRADNPKRFDSDGPWKSPIFMPRKFSRITLEITGVRVERLQEITDDDIAAEGIEIIKHIPGEFGLANPCATGTVDLPSGGRIHSTARSCFAELWDSINRGKFPWASDPWVFVISFRRVK